MRGTLALLIRSLRSDARSMLPHLGRMALLVPILFFLFLAQTLSSQVSASGLVIFAPLAYLNFVLITLAGTSYFATSITEEKEEQTLGLLRMAGVSPLALLLGKGVTRLVSAALILCVQFPFTLLVVTLGGVTYNQVVAVFLCLLAYTLLLSCWGLFCSVYCSRSARAAVLATIGIALLLFGPPILQGILWVADELGLLPAGFLENQTVSNLLVWLNDTSPFQRMSVILSSAFSQSPLSSQVIVNTIAAAVIFLLVWSTFDLFNREEVQAGPARGLISVSNHRDHARQKLRGPRHRAWDRALIWKDFYFIAGGPWMLIAKTIGYLFLCGLICGFFIALDSGQFDLEVCGAVAQFVAFFGGCVEISLMASRVFRDETRWKTLSNLAMLPTSLNAIAVQKLAGCLLGVLPAACLYCVGMLLTPTASVEFYSELIPSPWFYVAIAHLVLFWVLIAWVSLQVKWGALPLALAIMILGTFFVYSGVMMSFWMLAMTGMGTNIDSDFAEMFFLYFLPIFIIGGQALLAYLLIRATLVRWEKEAAA